MSKMWKRCSVFFPFVLAFLSLLNSSSVYVEEFHRSFLCTYFVCLKHSIFNVHILLAHLLHACSSKIIQVVAAMAIKSVKIVEKSTETGPGAFTFKWSCICTYLHTAMLYIYVCIFVDDEITYARRSHLAPFLASLFSLTLAVSPILGFCNFFGLYILYLCLWKLSYMAYNGCYWIRYAHGNSPCMPELNYTKRARLSGLESTESENWGHILHWEK